LSVLFFSVQLIEKRMVQREREREREREKEEERGTFTFEFFSAQSDAINPSLFSLV
jgi:hypothetical protein